MFKNANHNIPMVNLRILHELTNNFNFIRDFRSCTCFPTILLYQFGFEKVSLWSIISF